MKTKNFTDDQTANRNLLNKFLKKHRIYRKFNRNILFHSDFTVDWLLTDEKIDDLILGAFKWNKTLEGFNFWDNIDSLWRKYLKGVI